MAVSKVELNGETLINLQPTTAVEADVAEGKVFFKANGEQAVGEAVAGSSFAPEFISFQGCPEESITLTGLDTSNITSMEEMFMDTLLSGELNLSTFNTSNVTNMLNMFNGCSGLTTINLSSFDTSNVVQMGWMFGACMNLETLDLSSFNTSNVDDMGGMFVLCESLTSLDLSNFDTSNVGYMGSMFEGCSRLTSLDLSNFDTSHLAGMENMFLNCQNLAELNLSSFDFSHVQTWDGHYDIFNGVPSTCVIYVNQAGYNWLENQYNNGNAISLADINMLHVVSNE